MKNISINSYDYIGDDYVDFVYQNIMDRSAEPDIKPIYENYMNNCKLTNEYNKNIPGYIPKKPEELKLNKLYGFNMGMCKVPIQQKTSWVQIVDPASKTRQEKNVNDKIMISVRYTIRSVYGDDLKSNVDRCNIIPGNSPSCTNIINKSDNFIWLYFDKHDAVFQFNVLLVGSYNKNKFTVDKTIKPRFFTEKTAYKLIEDVRLFNVNNKMYIHMTSLISFYEIQIVNNNIVIASNNLGIDNRSRGMNYAFLSFQETKNKISGNDQYIFTFIDWYEYFMGVKKALRVYDIVIDKTYYVGGELQKSQSLSKLYGIKPEIRFLVDFIKDVPIGKHYHSKYGMFSFSTPTVETDEKNDYDFDKIGIGHVKIVFPSPINNLESNEQKFAHDAYFQFPFKFGNKYIQNQARLSTSYEGHKLCEGYIYLLYFYRIIKKTKDSKFEMHLSDGYLPINLSEQAVNKYKFSLIFPMGIIMKDNQLLMSFGEGDYYTGIISFNKEDVLKSIKHTSLDLDLKSYKYYLLQYNGKTTETTETLYTDTQLNQYFSTIQKCLIDINTEYEENKDNVNKYKTIFSKLDYIVNHTDEEETYDKLKLDYLIDPEIIKNAKTTKELLDNTPAYYEILGKLMKCVNVPIKMKGGKRSYYNYYLKYKNKYVQLKQLLKN